MEDPKIITNGENTLVDVELDGKPRRVSVSREWIEDRLNLSSQEAANLTTEQRQEFIKAHLGEIISAANAKRDHTSNIADLIFVHTRDYG